MKLNPRIKNFKYESIRRDPGGDILDHYQTTATPASRIWHLATIKPPQKRGFKPYNIGWNNNHTLTGALYVAIGHDWSAEQVCSYSLD